MSQQNGLIEMPASIFRRYHNGQTPDPCDMIEGPCVCGAWHHLYEWDEEVQTIVLKEHPWALELVSAEALDRVRRVYGEDSLGYRHLLPEEAP